MRKTVRQYTDGEEISHAVTHFVGSHLSAAATALMIWEGCQSGVDVGWKVTSASIMGASLILMYVISGTYHSVRNATAKRIMHVMDHSAIYFLIAGCYTPFCLVTLRPEHPGLAWTIFGVEWGATLIGTSFKVFTTGKFRVVSTLAYVAMGWMALAAIVPLVKGLTGLGTMWLATGGLAYTIGCVFYLWKSLPYAHMVWHLFVLAGSICHFFCVLWYVMGR
ncbi:MAG: hemolysin III family protein [Kiritimatiellae bacterium]|nr:hemolysin III family protein [Kiritimatiellia bacterium]